MKPDFWEWVDAIIGAVCLAILFVTFVAFAWALAPV